MGEGCFFDGNYESIITSSISVTDTAILFSQNVNSSDNSTTSKRGVLDRVNGQFKYTSTNRRADFILVMTIDGKCERSNKVF
jgi:hypothetical protein